MKAGPSMSSAANVVTVLTVDAGLRGVSEFKLMTTRSDSGSRITKLTALDGIASDTAPLRQLTHRELGLLAQSRDDFKAGRTLSFDELVGELDRELAPLGVPKYQA